MNFRLVIHANSHIQATKNTSKIIQFSPLPQITFKFKSYNPLVPENKGVFSGVPSGSKEITLSSGNLSLSYTPEKGYNYICISSPDMKTGESYSLCIDSTEIENFTQDSTVTAVGTAAGGMGGMGGGMKRPQGGMVPPR